MISICMIVKNEEKILEKCLQHLISLDYEIVIADTGSTDRSKEIALKYTNKVFDYVWTNDFSAARNFVIEKATSDCILTIDADEILTLFDKNNVETLIKSNQRSIGRIVQSNVFSRGKDNYEVKERIGRLFYKSEYYYTGTIHEQVTHKTEADNLYYDVPIEVHHEGYNGDLKERSNKSDRNISLLQKQLEISKDDAYILYQLGKSYYMKGAYDTACEWFEKAISIDIDVQLEYVQDLVESYGYALIDSGQYEKALQLINVYDDFSANADFVFLIGLILMNNAMFQEAIVEFEKATRIKRFKMDGVNSYRSYYNIGVILECIGETGKAREFYIKCGDYKPAGLRLNEI